MVIVISYFQPLLTHICVCSACNSLFEAAHPLIEAIRAYAGCCISLITGSPKKDDSKGFFTA